MKTVQAGNMSTLNYPEEVYLVERLIELHPWADMARLNARVAKLTQLRFVLPVPHRAKIRSRFAVITAGTIGTFSEFR